jgi:ribonuclease HII
MLKPYYKPNIIEAGVDEVGRGCLAGPVVAAAVILPQGYSNSLLQDSKQLKKHTREQLSEVIMQEAIAYAIAEVSHKVIDKINILQASIKAMHTAINQLNITPEFLLIDGHKFTAHASIPHLCVIKGDATYQSIAAASILAKTHRDNLMAKLHKQYPQYNWLSNQGYPTAQHRAAITLYGRSKWHRLSFMKLADVPTLF